MRETMMKVKAVLESEAQDIKQVTINFFDENYVESERVLKTRLRRR